MSASAKSVRLRRCEMPLSETARMVITARLEDMIETRGAISDPSDVEALHDLRIMAKRLRYSLEMFSVCFPDGLAQEKADSVRAMQDVLGRIHDLDVLHGLLHEHITRIDSEARQDALRVAMTPTDGSRRDEELLGLSRTDGKSDGRLGLYKLVAAKADERRQLYARFSELWAAWEDTGLLTGIRDLLSPVLVGADLAPEVT